MNAALVARFRLSRSPSPITIIGLSLVGFIVFLALFGPFFAPHPPDQPIGAPFSPSSANAPLGTDFLGRDVLARVLWGGRSVLALASLATALTYAAGLTIGLVAGFKRSWVDVISMRAIDVFISIPSLIFLLLLVTGLGTGSAPLVLGVALVLMPAVARIVRTATLEQAVRGYVEAAIARGEKTIAILWREILPNLASPIAADAGLRFTYAIILIASVNFLGLGLQPPAADWGVMVSENRLGISLNPWPILVPATLIGLLAISLNLLADRYAQTRERS